MESRGVTLQTKCGHLLLQAGNDKTEEVLVELTEDHLIVRCKEGGGPLNRNARLQNERNVYLKKDKSGSIGVTLEGGAELKTYVTIYQVQQGLPADRSGSVREGDVVIAVNYTDTTFSTVEEVKELIKTSNQKVVLHLAEVKGQLHGGNSKLLNMDNITDLYLVREILLENGPVGLGFSLQGGASSGAPITVASVEQNGIAYRSNHVFVDDVLLAVNGHDVRFSTLDEVELLLQSSDQYVTLQLGTLKEKDEDVQTLEVCLAKERGSLGLSITGGADMGSPIAVSAIVRNSPAGRCNDIHRGDVILAANGINMTSKTQEDLVEILQESGNQVTLLIKPKKRAKDELPIIKNIPLTMAYITCYKNVTDELRINSVQVVSAEGYSSVELSCERRLNSQVLQEWVSAIRTNIQLLNRREAERLSEEQAVIGEKVHLIGWVSERLSVNEYNQVWKRKFLALRSEALEIFSEVPKSVREWCRPESTLKLCEFNVTILKGRSQPNLRSHSIHVASGKGFSHVLAFEYAKNLAEWTQEIHLTTMRFVQLKKRIKFKVNWRGMAAVLVIDIETGFSVVDSSEKQCLWKQPLMMLVNSADDHINKLKLMFRTSNQRQQEVQVFEIDGLDLAICAMEAFLTTKVALSDPSFVYRPHLSMVAA